MDSSGEQIVISGISGRFPKSNNLSEFASNLSNKVDMIDGDESRWEYFTENVPKRFGKIGNLDKFDSSFFSILNKHADWTDPQIRMLLEHAYETFLDAGESPQAFIGSRTGVFIGNSESESKEVMIHQMTVKNGYAIFGNGAFYQPNRISYCLGLQGPSFRIDTACSSFSSALSVAVESIQNGTCDAALVGGCNLIMTFLSTAQFCEGGVLSPEGESRPFDENANGFVRSEAVGLVLLQRRKNAKRVYASILNTSVNNDGYKEQSSTFPSKEMQAQLMEEVYRKSNIDINSIGYVEAHATGTVFGDSVEVSAIDSVLCRSRNEPLVIGSIKSNMGHCEAAAGIASLAKIVLMLEHEKIFPNINLNSVRSDIAAFKEGRIKVATEVQDLKSNVVAMNSFGLGGSNAHILLKGNDKIKINNGIPCDDLNRLVLWSGRTEEAVKTIFDSIKQRPLDAEYIALLHNSQTHTNLGNNFRGYGIFKQIGFHKNAECVQQHCFNFPGTRLPVAFVYNGIGSQWNSMGAELLKIPLLSDSIKKSHKILVGKGVNLINILTSSDPKIFDNVLNSYVGIVAVQIALTDALRALDVKADYIIGHSLGEVSCAYADGCYTAEEALLVAYERGKANNDSKNINGAMAAIGLNYKEISNILPSDIDIACHNSPDSTTITGPAESVRSFTKKLSDEGVFAKEVKSSGVALHSRYIKEIGELMYIQLKKLLKDPKKRSDKWLSSTYPQQLWGTQEAQYSGPEYQVNNLLNPVLFNEVTTMLPSNVIAIEIGPHALLQSILKRSMRDANIIGLINRNDPNQMDCLLSSFGKLFEYGIDINIAKLYPPISFPVSRGTPMISPLIKWNHDTSFLVPIHDRNQYYQRRNVLINLSDHSMSFLQDHIIDGKIYIPATFLVCAVWETFNLMCGNLNKMQCVTFEDVKLTRITVLEKNQDIFLTVSINRGSGFFEVTERSALLAQGYIKKSTATKYDPFVVDENENFVVMTESDFYKEMRLRGYHHQGTFRGIKEIREDGMIGKIEWISNWTTFIDSMLQAFIIGEDTRALILPTYFGKIVLDPSQHFEMLSKIESNEKKLTFSCDPYMKIIASGGVQIYNFSASPVTRRRETAKPLLETNQFIPFSSDNQLTLFNVAKLIVQLLLEQTVITNISCVELDSTTNENIISEVLKAVKNTPSLKYSLTLLTKDASPVLDEVHNRDQELSSLNSLDMIINTNCIHNTSFLNTAASALNKTGYLICREKSRTDADETFNEFDVIAKFCTKEEIFYILRKKFDEKATQFAILQITSNINDWFAPLQNTIKNNQDLILYSQDDSTSGILGLFNCLRKEFQGKNLKCFFIDDNNAPKFDISNSFYQQQIKFDFALNVFRNGVWGSYRYLELVQEIEPVPQTDECYAKCLIRGDLNTLSWFQGSGCEKSENLMKIHYVGLNFKDLMLALGRVTPNVKMSRIDEERLLGIEWSGTDSKGQKIMCFNLCKSLATVIDSSSLILPVPEHLTLQEAATIPVVYATVYLSYFHFMKIQPGNSILIHSGASGLGIAAITIAFAYGLNVFTTIGTDEKREYLLKKFPQLKSENIGNSRDTSFEKMIMNATKGIGVKYILNSLSGDKFQASLRCISHHGSFVEVGKLDMMEHSKIDANVFTSGVSINSLFLDQLIVDSQGVEYVFEKLRDDLYNGIIKPIDLTIFEADKIRDAFKFISTGKHFGKVLIKVRENEKAVDTLPMRVFPSIHCRAKESFIIVGGLGGLGLEFADILILRGCRNLILNSPRGIKNAYQMYRINLWKSYGVKVIVSTSDATTLEGCKELIDVSTELGPVGGIFNLAVSLYDNPFEEQTLETFSNCLKPKSVVTKHLDEISQKFCPALRYFVVFSSLVGGRGNASQTNYGMANSIIERIIEQRHAKGLPAKAIQWGAIGDVGLLAKLSEKNREIILFGTIAQSISSCINVFDKLVTHPHPIVSSIVVALNQSSEGKKGNVVETIYNILGITDAKSVSLDTTLSKLGIDSLMGVEIQQMLERDYCIVFSAQELRNLTLREIEKRVLTGEEIDKTPAKFSIDFDKYIINHLGNEKLKDQVLIRNSHPNVKNGVVALIIPGFEGVTNDKLEKLSNSLQCPTYIVQLTKTFNATSLQEILSIIYNEIIDLFSNCRKFIIIGYSFGTLLALKIAHMLESLQKDGQVVMIDGSPLFLKKIFSEFMKIETLNEEAFHKRLFEMSLKILNVSISDDDFKSIVEKPTLDEKFQKFREFYTNEEIYSVNYFRMMTEAFVNRSKLIIEMKESSFSQLKNVPISLFKTTESSLLGLEEDYGLGKFSKIEIFVKEIEGNHQTIISSEELAKSINTLIPN